MKSKIVSLVLAATLAFAMAPTHAGNGSSESGSSSNKQDGGPSSQGTENGQGHIKYTDGTLKGKGLGHGKHHCVSCS